MSCKYSCITKCHFNGCYCRKRHFLIVFHFILCAVCTLDLAFSLSSRYYRCELCLCVFVCVHMFFCVNTLKSRIELEQQREWRNNNGENNFMQKIGIVLCSKNHVRIWHKRAVCTRHMLKRIKGFFLYSFAMILPTTITTNKPHPQ